MKDVLYTLLLTLILLVLLNIAHYNRQAGRTVEDEDDFTPCTDMVSQH